MKKNILILLLCLSLAMLSACSEQTNNPDNSHSTETSESVKPASSVSPQPSVESIADFKARFQGDGYHIIDNHGIEAEGLVGGFIILYRGEEGYWRVPVLEFDKDSTADVFAAQKKTEGFAAVIENKRFVLYIGENPDIVPGQAADEPDDKEGASDTGGDSGGVSLNDRWPTEIVPDLPEYIYGKISGFSEPDGYGQMAIRATGTSQDNLDKYLKTLESEGWSVTKLEYDGYAKAQKSTYTVIFELEGDSVIMFDITIEKAGEWPSIDEYPINTPKPEGYEIVGAEVSYYPDEAASGGAVGSFEFTCVNMTIDAALAYYQSLVDGGSFEPFTWQGKTYICATNEDQIMGDGANVHFYFEIWPAE